LVKKRGSKAAAIALDSALPSIFVGLRDATVQEPSFGDSPSLSNLKYLVEREPVAERIVVGVAHDVFDSWFKVVPHGDKTKAKDFDEKIQAELAKINAKNIFTQACVFERRDGWSVIVKGYEGSSTTGLREERKDGGKLVDIEAYPISAITVKEPADIDTDQNSLNFGLPKTYHIDRYLGKKEYQLDVHYSNIIHCVVRLSDSVWKGISALYPVFDDIVMLRCVRYSTAMTYWRYGCIALLTAQRGTTKDQLKTIIKDQIGPLHRRTLIALAEPNNLKFIGAEGIALPPEQFYEIFLESIAMGSDIPKPILRGAEAGSISGSEINERKYFKTISDNQMRYEPFIRSVIDDIIASGQADVDKVDYTLEWNPPLKMAEIQKSVARWNESRARERETSYKTVNEIRDELGLPHITDGEIVLGVERVKAQQMQFQLMQGQKQPKEKAEEGEPAT